MKFKKGESVIYKTLGLIQNAIILEVDEKHQEAKIKLDFKKPLWVKIERLEKNI